MLVADPSGPGAAVILWTVLGGYLAAGGAGAINHYLERDCDARMERTSVAPLVSGRIDPRTGSCSGLPRGGGCDRARDLTVNDTGGRPCDLPASWATSSSTRCGSSPERLRTSSSAAPPGRCRHSSAGRPPRAASSWDALYPFAIVFLWTPPHFWALALLIKDDYARAEIPMLPVVARRRGHAPPDPRLHRGAGCLHRAAIRHRALPRRLPGGRARPRRRLPRPGAAALAASLPPRGRLRSTSPRWLTWRFCSARWRWTGPSCIELAWPSIPTREVGRSGTADIGWTLRAHGSTLNRRGVALANPLPVGDRSRLPRLPRLVRAPRRPDAEKAPPDDDDHRPRRRHHDPRRPRGPRRGPHAPGRRRTANRAMQRG